MKTWLKFAVVTAAVMMTPCAVFAASPWTENSTYGGRALGKLDFGFRNIAAGWTEIFVRPMAYAHEGKDVIAGFGEGLFNTLVYTAGGMLHAATFPLTELDFPVPNNGVHFAPDQKSQKDKGSGPSAQVPVE